MLLAAKLFTDELVAQNFAYSAHDMADGAVVSFPCCGMDTNFIFSGVEGRYVSMYTLMAAVPPEKIKEVIQLCNTLNNETKWFKFYVDDENDLMMQDDAILLPEYAADECFELLERRIKVLEKVKATVLRAVEP
jgi:hypothetical protein